MKIIQEIEPFILLPIEISLQSNNIPAVFTPFGPDIHYYEDENHILRRIPRQAEVVRDEDYLIGILINGHVRPVCNASGERVLLSLVDRETLPMNPHIARLYGFGAEGPRNNYDDNNNEVERPRIRQRHQ